MSSTSRAVRPRRPKVKKATYRRRTFMFDEQTDDETSNIKRAIRATTASEAVRYAMRKMAEMMRHVKKGGKVYIDTKRGTVALDIPPAA